MAVATRADDLARFAQARTQALARKLQQAEARNLADLHACAILLECMLQTVFDRALVLARPHIDEVDDHQAAQVTQAHLAGHFFSGFQVGVVGGLFDVATLGGARGVDVDGGQSFGLVNHD